MQSKEPLLDELARLRREVNRMFEQVLLGSGYDQTPEAPPGTWVPEADVVEGVEHYRVLVELPGVDRRDLTVEIAGRQIDLHGRRRPRPGSGLLRLESSYGPFHWSHTLPRRVEERFEERLEGGVLELVLTKEPNGSRD